MNERDTLKIVARRSHEDTQFAYSGAYKLEPPVLTALQRRHLERYLKENWQDLIDLAILLRLQTAIRWNVISVLTIDDVGRNYLRVTHHEVGVCEGVEADNWLEEHNCERIHLKRDAVKTVRLILSQKRGNSDHLIAIHGHAISAKALKRRYIELCRELGLEGRIDYTNQTVL